MSSRFDSNPSNPKKPSNPKVVHFTL